MGGWERSNEHVRRRLTIQTASDGFNGRPVVRPDGTGIGESLVTDSTNPKSASTEAEPSAAALRHRAAADRQRNVEEQQLTLTATELATRLGISRAHVWKLLSLGRLPAPVRLGRAVRWDKRVIDAWLAAGAPSSAQWERMNQAEKAK